MSDAPEPVRWWSAKRFAEFVVHLAVFSVLWLSWSRFAEEAEEVPRMLLVGTAVAAGLTWGIPFWSQKKGGDKTP